MLQEPEHNDENWSIGKSWGYSKVNPRWMYFESRNAVRPSFSISVDNTGVAAGGTKKEGFWEGIFKKKGKKGKEGLFRITVLQRINFMRSSIRNSRAELRRINNFLRYQLVTFQDRFLGFIANTNREQIWKTNSCRHSYVSITLSVIFVGHAHVSLTFIATLYSDQEISFMIQPIR